MLKKLPLILILLINALPSRASYSAGAEVTYKYLGNSQYAFQIKVYRDCRGIPLKSITVGWFAGKNTSMSCGYGSLTGFVRTSITDINYTCSNTSKLCNPSNTSGSGAGFERHIWEDTLDLSQAPFSTALAGSNCTEFNVWVGSCCRNGGITTGPANSNFFVTCQVNIGNLKACKNKGNSSVTRNVEMPMFACCNQPFFYNPGLTDSADFDSLSVELAEPIGTLPNTGVSYTSPYTYRYPVTSYCVPPTSITCSPRIDVDPPRGTYIDNLTGDLIFTPINCSEVTVFAIDVTEWRRDTTGKMVAVGKTRQDLQLTINDNCGYNKEPRLSGNWKTTVIAGEKICQKFVAYDPPFLPYQTVKDTINEVYGGENSKAVFTVSNDTLPNIDTITFCLQTTLDDTSRVLQHFYLQSMDNHCTMRRVTTKGFIVQVLKPDSLWVSVNRLPCNSVKLAPNMRRGDPSKAKYVWYLYDSAQGKLMATGSGSSLTANYLPKGSYRYLVKTENIPFGYTDVTGFFTINSQLISAVLITKPVCNGGSGSVTAAVQNNQGKVNYKWSVDTTTKSVLELQNLTADVIVKLTATDSVGCIATATDSVKVFSIPTVAWKSAPLPQICGNTKPFQVDSMVLAPDRNTLCSGSFIIWSKLTREKTFNVLDSVNHCKYIYDASRISPSQIIDGKSVTDSLFITFTDANGCANTAATRIRINGYPIVDLTNLVYCQNAGSAKLDSAVIRPKVIFGTRRDWYALEWPTGIDGSKIVGDFSGGSGTDWRFLFGNKTEDKYAGNYKLRMVVTDQITGCKGDDTTDILIVGEPVLSAPSAMPEFCHGLQQYSMLGTYLSGGKPPVSGKAIYKILSWNGDTSSIKWKGISFSGDNISGGPKTGLWKIKCTYAPQGCPESFEADFRINPVPVALFKSTPDSIATVTQPIFSFDNQSTISSGNLSYFWDFDHPHLILTSNALSPQVQYPMKDSTYRVRLTATSDKGCVSFYEKTVQVGKGRYNSLSDLTAENLLIGNDFTIAGIPWVSMEIRVFDLSGKLVARRINNQPVVLPPGTYIYGLRIYYGGESFVTSGKKVIVE